MDRRSVSVLAASCHSGFLPELTELEREHASVTRILEEKYADSPPTIYKGGSRAKQTMIKEAYDRDLPTYFGPDNTSAGASLEDIFKQHCHGARGRLPR